jgi:hypothetical protein
MKTILLKLRECVSLGILVLGAGACCEVLAQTTQMNPYITDKGCNFLWPGRALQEPISWTGRCENALAAGSGVLTYQLSSDPGRETLWHMKTLLIEGKQSGISWTVADAEKRRFSDVDSINLRVNQKGERVASIFIYPGDSMEQVLKIASSKMTEALDLGLPSLTSRELQADIRRWHKNPTTAWYLEGGDPKNGASVSSSGNSKVTKPSPSEFLAAVLEAGE